MISIFNKSNILSNIRRKCYI